MQIEIKCALEFLLSYLYDKLPRRRVNLFGDELEKYLKLKLMTSDSKICLNINFKQNNMELIDPCLIAASKESAMDLKEILECWPKHLKLFIENGMVTYSLDQDLNQQQQEDSAQSDQVKVIYNEKTDSFLLPASTQQNIGSPQAIIPENQFFDMFQMSKGNNNINKFEQNIQQQQNRRSFKHNNNNKIFNNQPNHLNLSPNNNNNKSRGLNLNFNNVKSPNNMCNSTGNPWSFNNTPVGATSPFQQAQDFLSLSSSSSSASASSSSSHLSNPPEDLINQIVTSPTNPNNNNNSLVPNVKTPTGSNVSMFTTAAFAQTKFGSTKSKNNYTRQSKQHKMLPNEFSAYIRNKVKMLNGNCNGNLTKIDHNMNMNGDNYVDYAFLNDQIPSISLTSYSTAMSPQLQSPPSFFKNPNENCLSFDTTNNLMKNFKYNQNTGNTPGVAEGTSPSQLFQPELLLTNSSINELDDNLLSNYFSSTFSSPSSSTTSSSSSSTTSSYNTEKSSSTELTSDMMMSSNNNNLLNQINNLTI